MNLKQLLTNLNPFKPKQAPEVLEETPPESKPEEKVSAQKRGVFGPPQKGDTWKISELDKQMIVSLWASGLTPSEVIERAREEFNIEVSVMQVHQYSKAEKWQPLIKKIRQETFNDLAAVAGSHKKVRLGRHEKIYEKAIKKNDLKHALAATEGQRKEMEGGGDTLSITLNQYNVLSDDELEAKKKEVMEKIARTQKGVIDVKPAD